ncbi:hypothetical protein ACFWY9_32555 [Amycolatopsis sp. NPDC059027]|uniref:hypothetical protein n=1 Tax=unclassified Amycolatopsis TaxID=2618356 RepID=UPI00366BCA61
MAWQLFSHLASGHAPYEVPTSLRLDGPVLMDQVVHLGVYLSEDVQYKIYDTSPSLILKGAPILGLAGMAVNRWRNSASRRQAMNQSAPQWRACGPLRVVVTDRSTWIQENGEWNWIAHASVTEMRVDPYAGLTEMSSEQMPPLRLDGPAAAFAGILIAYFVYAGQFATIPGLGPFADAMR